jgi:hypothetical protein
VHSQHRKVPARPGATSSQRALARARGAVQSYRNRNAGAERETAIYRDLTSDDDRIRSQLQLWLQFTGRLLVCTGS